MLRYFMMFSLCLRSAARSASVLATRGVESWGGGDLDLAKGFRRESFEGLVVLVEEVVEGAMLGA